MRVNRGRLILVVGASGCGKDTLLAGARHILVSDPRLAFAHRYITRPADCGGENHVALTVEEFAQRRHARLFALDWASHGLSYALGIEIDHWMAGGIHVIANGSRAHLANARHRYPDLVALEIRVAAETLRRRLQARGRETSEQINQRLQRHALLAPRMPTIADFRIDNDSTPDDGIGKLVDCLCTLITEPSLPCA